MHVFHLQGSFHGDSWVPNYTWNCHGTADSWELPRLLTKINYNKLNFFQYLIPIVQLAFFFICRMLPVCKWNFKLLAKQIIFCSFAYQSWNLFDQHQQIKGIFTNWDTNKYAILRWFCLTVRCDFFKLDLWWYSKCWNLGINWTCYIGN